MEKFEGLVIEELHEEINAFVEIFNNAYEAWKWIQQYDKAIEEIKYRPWGITSAYEIAEEIFLTCIELFFPWVK